MGTSRESGGGSRRATAVTATAQRPSRRPAPVRPGTPPRRTAMPKPGPNGTYRVSADEFERATGRRVGR